MKDPRGDENERRHKTLLRTPVAHAAVEIAAAMGAACVVVRYEPTGLCHLEFPRREVCSQLLRASGLRWPPGQGRTVLVIADHEGAVAVARAWLAPLSRGGEA